MSDFNKGDTASWDASQVRRARGERNREQGGREEGSYPPPRRRHINPLLYHFVRTADFRAFGGNRLAADVGFLRIQPGVPSPR